MPAKPYSIKAGFKDMRRAFADTKMTGCTLLLKVFPTDRSRRSDRIFFFVCLFAFQSCNGFFGLGQEFGGCSGSNKTGNQKRRLDESVSGDDGTGVSTFDLLFL